MLKVKRAKPEDAGIYQCQAENVAGKSVGKSVVTIRAGKQCTTCEYVGSIASV